jgi:hypothetical protein
LPKRKYVKREEWYLRLLKPEYNVSTTPSASFLGLTHSEIARSKIGASKLGNRYGEALKGRVRSAETIKKNFRVVTRKSKHKRYEGL